MCMAVDGRILLFECVGSEENFLKNFDYYLEQAAILHQGENHHN